MMPIIRGRDVIAQAQSGTGKTSLFSICALQAIDTRVREAQVLSLSPTRELAVQSYKVMMAIGDHMNVRDHACVGGRSLSNDIKTL